MRTEEHSLKHSIYLNSNLNPQLAKAIFLFLSSEKQSLGQRYEDHLPDKSLQDERRSTFLKLQLFVVQSLGVGTALGSSLPQQHNSIIISEGQRALEKETNCTKLPSC